MGKKNKGNFNDDASNSGKRTKTSLVTDIPVPEQPLCKVIYDNMPENHKKKFYIYDDCGSVMRYIEVICWLRTMGSFDGSSFLGIGNLNWSGEGYPLVEIEVTTPQGRSAKFLIAKGTLYVTAFSTRNGFYQFYRCTFDIDGCIMLGKSYVGRYTDGYEPWSNIGPKAMIDAVNALAMQDLLDVNNAKVFVDAAEVFFFHLSEAARVYEVEVFVCRSLEHSVNVQTVNKCLPTYQDEAERFLVAQGGGRIAEKNDAYGVVKVDGYPNFDASVQAPAYIEDLVKKYSNLSKEWYIYALTDKKVFDMNNRDVSRFHMRSVKSLRSTLAVLCNINLDKLLPVWRKKIATHSQFSLDDYKQMERRIRQLQARRKVLVVGDDTGVEQENMT